MMSMRSLPTCAASRPSNMRFRGASSPAEKPRHPMSTLACSARVRRCGLTDSRGTHIPHQRQCVRIHMVIHESFEAPGAFETWARIRGHAIGYSRLHAGEVLPRSADGFDLLVILGGPQSPSTTIRECPHFDAEAEKA